MFCLYHVNFYIIIYYRKLSWKVFWIYWNENPDNIQYFWSELSYKFCLTRGFEFLFQFLSKGNVEEQNGYTEHKFQNLAVCDTYWDRDYGISFFSCLSLLFNVSYRVSVVGLVLGEQISVCALMRLMWEQEVFICRVSCISGCIFHTFCVWVASLHKKSRFSLPSLMKIELL